MKYYRVEWKYRNLEWATWIDRIVSLQDARREKKFSKKQCHDATKFRIVLVKQKCKVIE